MIRGLLLASAALIASDAVATPRLDPLFGDHALIQRDQPVTVTGTAEPGEPVVVTLGSARTQVTAGRDGRFTATLPAMPAGGPLVLAATAPSGRAEARDVLMGDLFLCSGQSNMEFTVSRSQGAPTPDDKVRLFTIHRKTALTPQTTLPEVTPWAASTPDSARDFSAVCLFMAQALRKSSGVPIGAIHSSWGGTQIAAWMGDAAQRAAGRGAQADLLALYRRDPVAGARQAGQAWEAWWRAQTGDRQGGEPWQPAASLGWQPVPKIGVWEEYGDPRLAAYDGMVWFRRDVTLTAAQAQQRARLEIGAVDDMDQSWVNGVAIGSGGNPSEPRSYPLAPGVLSAGSNTVVVNANDAWGQGGMRGPADRMRLVLADGTVVPLDTGWRYVIAKTPAAPPPRAPWDDIAGAGVIYNAMIAPLGRIGLKGVAWYQGESDVGIPGYAERLRAMMADWRRLTGVRDLPFAVVQLANYGAFATAPIESGWAALRDEQRRAVAVDGHAALAVTLDLGDPFDIHPTQKPEVGRRLALAMASVAYGSSVPAGPTAIGAAQLSDGSVRVSFAGVTGALTTRGAGRAIGFELCSATPGSCRAVLGTASGSTVTLAGDGGPSTRVRYAWADSPTVNLVDAAGLPPGSFEMPVR